MFILFYDKNLFIVEFEERDFTEKNGEGLKSGVGMIYDSNGRLYSCK